MFLHFLILSFSYIYSLHDSFQLLHKSEKKTIVFNIANGTITVAIITEIGAGSLTNKLATIKNIIPLVADPNNIIGIDFLYEIFWW